MPTENKASEDKGGSTHPNPEENHAFRPYVRPGFNIPPSQMLFPNSLAPIPGIPTGSPNGNVGAPQVDMATLTNLLVQFLSGFANANINPAPNPIPANTPVSGRVTPNNQQISVGPEQPGTSSVPVPKEEELPKIAHSVQQHEISKQKDVRGCEQPGVSSIPNKEEHAPVKPRKFALNGQETKYYKPKDSKKVQLAEVKENFCSKTSVKDVLQSLWYRRHMAEASKKPDDSKNKTSNNNSNGQIQTEANKNQNHQLLKDQDYYLRSSEYRASRRKSNNPQRTPGVTDVTDVTETNTTGHQLPSAATAVEKTIAMQPMDSKPLFINSTKREAQLLTPNYLQQLQQQQHMQQMQLKMMQVQKQQEHRKNQLELLQQFHNLQQSQFHYLSHEATPVNLFTMNEEQVVQNNPTGNQTVSSNVANKSEDNCSTTSVPIPVIGPPISHPPIDHAIQSSIPQKLHPSTSAPDTVQIREQKPSEDNYKSSKLFALIQDDTPKLEVKKEQVEEPKTKLQKIESVVEAVSSNLQHPVRLKETVAVSKKRRGRPPKDPLVPLKLEPNQVHTSRKLHVEKLEISEPTAKKLKQEVPEPSTPIDSVSNSLKFLQSLSQLDGKTIFSGTSVAHLTQKKPVLEPETLIIEKPDVLVENTVTPVALATQGKQQEEIRPVAVWTNETGPLVPLSMYEKKTKNNVKKIIITKAARKLMPTDRSTSPSNSTVAPEINGENNVQEDSTSKKTVQIDQVVKTKPIPTIRERRKRYPRNVRRRIRRFHDKFNKFTIGVVKQYISDRKVFFQNIFDMHRNHGLPDSFKSFLKVKKPIRNQTDRYYVCKAYNKEIDLLASRCSTVVFEEEEGVILSRWENGTERAFEVNKSSTDTSSRWDSWTDWFFFNSFVNGRKEMTTEVLDEMRELLPIASMKCTNWETSMNLSDCANTLETMYHDVRATLKTFETNFSSSNFNRIYAFKLNAVQARVDWYQGHLDDGFVEEKVTEWKNATISFMLSTPQSNNDTFKTAMDIKLRELYSTAEIYYATVDIIMIALRLRVLYHHGILLQRGAAGKVENESFLRSVEDTEYLLILAEAKLLLLENPNADRRNLDLINAYLAADVMNVAKGEYRRCIMLENEQSMKNCEEKLSKAILELAKCCDKIGWTGIREHLTVEKMRHDCFQSSLGRPNLIVVDDPTDYNYSDEIPAKFFSKTLAKQQFYQMNIKSPQMSSAADEKLMSIFDGKKNVIRNYLRFLLPLCRRENVNDRDTMRILHQTVDLKTCKGFDVIVLKARANKMYLKKIRAEFEKHHSYNYNPATSSESALPNSVKIIFDEFRRMKRDEAQARLDAENYLENIQKAAQNVGNGNGNRSSTLSPVDILANKNLTVKDVIKTLQSLHKAINTAKTPEAREEAQRMLDHHYLVYKEIQTLNQRDDEVESPKEKVERPPVANDQIIDVTG